MNDDILWKVTNVAKFLQVSRSWVYHAADSGRLPSLKVGGLLRFQPDEIKEWVQRQGRSNNVLSMRDGRRGA
jgi:excisionase family DNA binding protein